MFKKLNVILATFVCSLGLAIAVQIVANSQANAQLFTNSKSQACEGTQLSGRGSNCLPGERNRINNIISTIINILSIVIGIAAVIMILVNGLRFITSGGDSNSVGNAKRGIIYAIIGLIIVALAQFIVFFVLRETGQAVNPPESP